MTQLNKILTTVMLVLVVALPSGVQAADLAAPAPHTAALRAQVMQGRLTPAHRNRPAVRELEGSAAEPGQVRPGFAGTEMVSFFGQVVNIFREKDPTVHLGELNIVRY